MQHNQNEWPISRVSITKWLEKNEPFKPNLNIHTHPQGVFNDKKTSSTLTSCITIGQRPHMQFSSGI